MTRFRFQFWKLIVLVALVAGGLAALKNPTRLGASAVYTASLGALLVFSIGALTKHGNLRLTWLGYAIFAWGYLVHVLVTGVFQPPPLIIDEYIEPLKAASDFSESIDPITHRGIYKLSDSQRQVAHSLNIVLMGILGSILARFFGGTKPPQSHPTGR